MTRRIDLHYHVIPPDYVARLTRRGIHGSSVVEFPPWSVERALDDLDHNGVATAITSLSTPGVQFGDRALGRTLARLSNEFQARMVADHPGRFGALAFLPLPDVEGSLVELEYALGALGHDGVVLLSDVEGVTLGHPSQDELFAELDRRHVPVLVHPHAEREQQAEAFHPLLEWPVHTTRAILNLLQRRHLERFPSIRFIVAHGGGIVPFLARRIVTDGVADDPGEVARLRSVLQTLYYDTGLLAEPHLACLRALVGAAHIVFGTDGGWSSRHQTAASLQTLVAYEGFDPARRAAIEHGNALALLPRLAREATVARLPRREGTRRI